MGTNKIFTEFLPRFQIDVALCDTTDHEAIEAEVAKGCKVLYLESPTNPTIKIVDLANKMIRLSGMETGRDIEIIYTGLREGEKLYEELLNQSENCIRTQWYRRC